MAKLKLGLCQLWQDYDLESNRARAYELARQAADGGAQIIALPEMFACAYEPAAILALAEIAPDISEDCAELAHELGCYLVAGSLPLRVDGRLKNRAQVFGPDGSLVHVHDKLHLFDCQPPDGPLVRESATVSAGDELKTFETPWGRAAVLICYDLRFSPLTEILASQDVRLLFVPAAFSLATGQAHWEMLVRLRAVELQGYVVGIQPATNHGLAYVPWGHSMVAGPWGEIAALAGSAAELLLVELDLAAIEQTRARFPLKRHHRSELYSTRWENR
ncbi:MAG: 2-oxoglutaramate amidase [Deltaproteobacteria bacterium ADurb.Bin510]|nr:MAG: 2-oxoglutaramate amidase [Deltaproteobacteria bacterium ADurb.Bin510]